MPIAASSRNEYGVPMWALAQTTIAVRCWSVRPKCDLDGVRVVGDAVHGRASGVRADDVVLGVGDDDVVHGCAGHRLDRVLNPAVRVRDQPICPVSIGSLRRFGSPVRADTVGGQVRSSGSHGDRLEEGVRAQVRLGGERIPVVGVLRVQGRVDARTGQGAMPTGAGWSQWGRCRSRRGGGAASRGRCCSSSRRSPWCVLSNSRPSDGGSRAACRRSLLRSEHQFGHP